MSNELINFNFEDKRVRHILLDDEPWWIAKDVCDILGLTDVSKSVERLDVDEKLIRKFFVSGQNRNVVLINEPGLYSLINRSNKPEAKRFKRWINHDVLPSIRKTGQYKIKEVTRLEMAQMLLKAEQDREIAEKQVKKLKNQAILDKPKIDMYNQLMNSKTNCELGTLANVLGIPGLGRNKLFSYLRGECITANGIVSQLLGKDRILRYVYSGGKPHNEPYRKYIDQKLFVLKEVPVKNNDMINFKCLVTPKGQAYIYRLVAKCFNPDQELMEIG